MEGRAVTSTDSDNDSDTDSDADSDIGAAGTARGPGGPARLAAAAGESHPSHIRVTSESYPRNCRSTISNARFRTLLCGFVQRQRTRSAGEGPWREASRTGPPPRPHSGVRLREGLRDRVPSA